LTKYREKIELIVDYFRKSECPREERKLGIEVEHMVVEADSFRAVNYYEDEGIEDLLKALVGRNWDPVTEEGYVIGLENSNANVSLEPGGQLELSILPRKTISELEEIYLSFVRGVVAILDSWDKSLLCVGYQPKSCIDEIPMVPKQRYDYMRDYFGNKGKYAYNMMKGTGATHVNLDFRDEQDYAKKNLVANILSPLVYSVLDNAPFFEGEVNRKPGLRRKIWENCDEERCGYPSSLFGGDFSYSDYAKYFLSVPPMVYSKDGELVYSEDKPLEDILLEDLEPSEEEIEYLLTTIFPDVRTKDHLEIRMGDSLPYPYNIAYLAFWRGLLYDEANLDNLYERYKRLSSDQFLERKEKLADNGPKAAWGRETVFSAYRNLLELAETGLGSEDKGRLESLMELAKEEITPRDKTQKLLSEGKVKALSWCNMNEIINQEE